MLAARTDKQKDSQDAYMEKLQDIKVRVPKEYYDKIKECADKKGLSINKLVISLLENEIGERIKMGTTRIASSTLDGLGCYLFSIDNTTNLLYPINRKTRG